LLSRVQGGRAVHRSYHRRSADLPWLGRKGVELVTLANINHLLRAISTTALTACALITGVSGVAFATENGALPRAAQYLINAQLPSGFFDFEMDFLSAKKEEVGNEDSIKDSVILRMRFLARQASAAYALAKYYYFSKDESVRERLVKSLIALKVSSAPMRKPTSLSWIERAGLTSVPFGQIKLSRLLYHFGVLYEPKGAGRVLALDGDYTTAFAGSTALALMAELFFSAVSGDHTFEDTRTAWLEGLMSFHMLTGGFRQHPLVTLRNPYSDGEAWLALALHAEILPELPQPLLNRIDDEMIRMYAGQRSMGFFPWGMMAAASRFRATSEPKFLDFITQEGDQILQATKAPFAEDDNTCSLVEGLTAAAGALQSVERINTELGGRLNGRINSEMAKNRALQIEPAQERIGLAEGAYFFSERLGQYAGAFMAGRYIPYTRTDYTGHCMSAIIEMQWVARTR
jgi:hypothetical protein